MCPSPCPQRSSSRRSSEQRSHRPGNNSSCVGFCWALAWAARPLSYLYSPPSWLLVISEVRRPFLLCIFGQYSTLTHDRLDRHELAALRRSRYLPGLHRKPRRVPNRSVSAAHSARTWLTLFAISGEIAWRLQTASSVLPTIVLLSLIYPCSESPRFLMKRGRFRAAYEALVLLRGSPILAATELFYVHCQMLVEAHFMALRKEDAHSDVERISQADGETKHTLMSHFRIRPRGNSAQSVNYWQRWRQLFTVPRNQRALCAAIVCMISQQLCGVNVLAFYSSTLFCDASNPPKINKADPSYLKPLFLSWGIGLSNFVFAFPAYWLIDLRGRRWLLLAALPFMALTMLAAGLSFLIPDGGTHAPVIGVFTYLFMFFYSWSM